jgi:hypothetical protein
MDNIDKNIIAGLMDLITQETDASFIAEVLDDIYFILAQNAVTDPDRVLQGRHELDTSMYYLHYLRDIFAGKVKPELEVV